MYKFLQLKFVFRLKKLLNQIISNIFIENFKVQFCTDILSSNSKLPKCGIAVFWYVYCASWYCDDDKKMIYCAALLSTGNVLWNQSIYILFADSHYMLDYSCWRKKPEKMKKCTLGILNIEFICVLSLRNIKPKNCIWIFKFCFSSGIIWSKKK